MEALLARGHFVIAIDDLSTGTIWNLDEARKNPRFSYYVDSVMNERLMAELVDRVDMVYHLAAAVGVRLIVEQPVHTIETNIRGTEIVLELAARKRKKVLLTSTSEVYGKSAKVPFSENDDLVLGSTTRPRWAYACSKAIDEFLGLAYYRQFGMPVIIARLFNTVGPRQTGQYGMVVPRFVEQALRGEPLTVYGDGQQTRAFAYVGDVVEGLIALMEEGRAPGEVFNVGNDQEISIANLAGLVIERTRSSSTIEFIPFERAYDENFEDLQRRVPDLSKIRKFIGYSPKVGIEEIIDRVAAYVKERLK